MGPGFGSDFRDFSVPDIYNIGVIFQRAFFGSRKPDLFSFCIKASERSHHPGTFGELFQQLTFSIEKKNMIESVALTLPDEFVV
ncbi:hypothetical protein SDC9_53211 [bioreactor metagenome]|uniref:Uncharacterized protein n=1 Tax=bioreactor metagenome TaxID=1076179 RepID=A0A644WTW1_9ZZZZ